MMTIDEFVATLSHRGPPLAPEEIDAFEREIGHTLPEDYRRFLSLCNGGFGGGRFWFVDAGVHHVGGLREESSFSLRHARRVYQLDEPRIPRSLIWIMDDPFGNAICLGVSGIERDRVFFWDHEGEPDPENWDGQAITADNVEMLAESFTDFVEGLEESDYGE
ncbi:MAG TPA: SMI1/KNR4 family protein [Longimicrobium sp.]|nr:SMI1/KNR4 family protein [Longimicrobium sp.]